MSRFVTYSGFIAICDNNSYDHCDDMFVATLRQPFDEVVPLIRWFLKCSDVDTCYSEKHRELQMTIKDKDEYNKLLVKLMKALGSLPLKKAIAKVDVACACDKEPMMVDKDLNWGNQSVSDDGMCDDTFG